MDLALTILASLGALLILLGYLKYVFSGFRHHFVTGLISILPVLNIVTVPALWSKSKANIFIVLIGIIITSISLFLGSNAGIHKFFNLFNSDSEPSNAEFSIVNPLEKEISNPSSSINFQNHLDNEKVQNLPKKALYRMAFEVISIDKINSLTINSVVQVVTTSNDIIEGRITNFTSNTISIQNNEMLIANIKKISVMVKSIN